MTKYDYDTDVRHEIERAVRAAIPLPRVNLTRASLADDFGGIDAVYTVNQSCKLQLRCRFNRPAYAADSDVTFRTTEWRMIAADTYAPLMLFLWLRAGHVVAGRLVDVYRMADRITPTLKERPPTSNGDGTSFVVVTIAELQAAGALLRMGDDDHWIAGCLGGNVRTLRIIEATNAR